MAVDLHELPLPGSSQLEIMFRRMLLQCAQRTEQHTDSHSDWRSDPRFHCITEALQEKLYDLEHSTADRPSPDVLQLYKAHVKAIVGELRQPDLPAYCLRVTAQDRVPDATSDAASSTGVSSSAGKGAAAAALLNATRSSAQQSSARDPSSSSSSTHAGGTRTTTAAAPSRDAAFSLSSSAQEQLHTQERLQDDITGELLDMGQELKASTLAMQSAIRFRGKLLDDAEVALVNSTANAQAVAAKAKEQYKQGSWNFCQTLLILLVVTVMFSWMIIYIKMTSMVGITGR